MPRPTDQPAKSTSGRVGDPGVFESAQSDEVVVQAAFLEKSSSVFEDFLADLSEAVSLCATDDLESEMARWLNQLAQQLGVERCAIGEFYGAEDEPKFLLQWTVGKQPMPYAPEARAWIQGNLVAGQVMSISSLDEFPADARAARGQLEEMGVRSGLWVPMMVEGSAVGGVGLTMLSREKEWSTGVIQRLRLVANVFGNALLRRRRAEEVEERSQFEALITDISTRYMNPDSDIDSVTDEVLSELGSFLKADRISYLEVNPKENSLVMTRQWTTDASSDGVPLQYVNVSARFKWLSARIIRNEPVAIEHLDQLPDEARNERKYCEEVALQSFIMVPATIDGVVVGAMALDNWHKPRTWNELIINRLHTLASIIVGAKDRERAQNEIAELRRFERVVSKVSTAFVNLAPEAVDGEIETGLGAVADALGADLITLLQPRGNAGYEVTHEWTSDTVQGLAFKGTSVEKDFPWLFDQLMERRTVAISTLSEFPVEAANERAAMEKVGLESVIWVPFDVRGQLAGHLAINTVRQRAWSEELAPELRLLGEVFGGAMSRRDDQIQLQKSFKEIEALKQQLQRENLYLRREIRRQDSHDDIVGDSAALCAALKKAEQVAATDSTVLITGETGTGKELLAHAIHDRSRRSERLMVKVNCAALPSSLVEAELFGREKGAYTGALSREPGRFETADGSTILLDEIAELSMELQAKLLRVLESGEFERLGSSKTHRADVRVLAATNRDLAQAVENKEFREDLYYRLNVFPIEVPPLRDRIEDIPQLVWAFVREFSETMGKTIESIPIAAMDALKAYSWPGNVREVRNFIERAMIVSQGPILEVELPQREATPGKSTVASRQLADVEREHILAVVEATGWRIRGEGGAAEILGLKPTTLEARMKKLGLERTA